jgi:hypothetical protein
MDLYLVSQNQGIAAPHKMGAKSEFGSRPIRVTNVLFCRFLEGFAKSCTHCAKRRTAGVGRFFTPGSWLLSRLLAPRVSSGLRTPISTRGLFGASLLRTVDLMSAKEAGADDGGHSKATKSNEHDLISIHDHAGANFIHVPVDIG